MNPRTWFRKLSIRWKIFIPFLTITLITTSIFTVYGFIQNNEAIINSIDKRLLIAALTMKQILPEQYFNQVTNAASIDQETSLKYSEKLEHFIKNVGATYLYALYKSDGKYYFVASADPTTPYWTEYEQPAPNIFEIEKNWTVNVSTTHDPEYGLLRSVVIPYVDGQGRRFIIGADIHAYEVDALMRRAFLNFVYMGTMSFILAIIFSYLASYTITKPLTQLSSFTHKLIASDFSSSIRLDRSIFPDGDKTKAETALLAFNFDHMQHNLEDHIQQLKLTQTARERAESELRIAGQIQETFLPGPFDTTLFDGNIDLFATMKTAKQAGGDLYDYFKIDDEHLCFIIGDVSGKGMPAAMFMSVVVVMLRAVSKQTHDPSEMIRRINDGLADRNESCTFVTLFVAILNITNGKLTFSNGGHNPPRLLSNGHVSTVNVQTNFVVGAMEDMTFQTEYLTIQPHDKLFLYTDGVTEAINEDEAFYGEPRMDDLLASINPDKSAKHIATRVSEDVLHFTGNREQADDITVMCLAFK